MSYLSRCRHSVQQANSRGLSVAGRFADRNDGGPSADIELAIGVPSRTSILLPWVSVPNVPSFAVSLYSHCTYRVQKLSRLELSRLELDRPAHPTN